VAAPEVGENDDTGDRRVCTPKGGERVAFELHYNQENYQVCSAEDNHHLDLRKKQRTASCNHIERRNRRIIRRLIDVNVKQGGQGIRAGPSIVPSGFQTGLEGRKADILP